MIHGSVLPNYTSDTEVYPVRQIPHKYVQGRPMDRLFTVSYLPACLLVLVLLLRFKLPGKLNTPHFRIISSFIGFAVIMFIIPVVRV